MPTPLVMLLLALAVAIVMLGAGIAVARRGTGHSRTVGAWVTVVGGLAALSAATTISVALIGASMDDVPGLW